METGIFILKSTCLLAYGVGLFETCVRGKCHDMIMFLGRYIYILLIEKPA
jgi:hypothetical protein